jgi:hypothetical protein
MISRLIAYLQARPGGLGKNPLSIGEGREMKTSGNKDTISRTIDVIRRNYLLLLVLITVNSVIAILDIVGMNQFFLMILLSVISGIIACGTYSALWQYSVTGRYNFIEGIKKNIIGYIAASLISFLVFSMLILVLAFLMKGSLPFDKFVETPRARWAALSAGAIYTSLLVFMYPYVFTRGQGLDAFIKGIKYIIKNIKKSLFPIAISLCWGSMPILRHFLQVAETPMAISILYTIAENIIIIFLMYFAFLIASLTLGADSSEGDTHDTDVVFSA